MSHAHTRSHLFLLPLVALSLAACGDDSSGSSYGSTTPDSAAANTTPANTTPADTTPADTTPADTTTPTPGGATLQLAKSSLGEILVDSAGNTLYLYANDTPTATACSTGCLGTWPALVSDGPVTVGAGLGLEDVGSVTAADGSTQVTFYGHPLYSFAGDAAPGDVNGQGIGGVWFVLDGEGTPVK